MSASLDDSDLLAAVTHSDTPNIDTDYVQRVTSALALLGRYTGDNNPGEHDLEAARLGVSPAGYRHLLTSVLLGAAQREAMDSDPGDMTVDQLTGSYQQQLIGAGVVDDDNGIRMLLIWQALRLWGVLRLLETRPGFDHPSQTAAAQALHAVRLLLTDAALKRDLGDSIDDQEWTEVRDCLVEALHVVDDLRPRGR